VRSTDASASLPRLINSSDLASLAALWTVGIRGMVTPSLLRGSWWTSQCVHQCSPATLAAQRRRLHCQHTSRLRAKVSAVAARRRVGNHPPNAAHGDLHLSITTDVDAIIEGTFIEVCTRLMAVLLLYSQPMMSDAWFGTRCHVSGADTVSMRITILNSNGVPNHNWNNCRSARPS